MIQDAVEESSQPRIPYDHRIFLVQDGDALLILNGKEIPIGADTLIYLSVRDRYYFKGKIRAAILNFDMTMACCDRKQPICPAPKEQYRNDLTFDVTQVEGFESAIVLTADELLKREILSIVDTYIQGNAFSEAPVRRCSNKRSRIYALLGNKEKTAIRCWRRTYCSTSKITPRK